MAESATILALWTAAGTDQDIATAIFSGTRTKTAISWIKRIAESTETPLDPEIKETLEHLSRINEVRDRIVHWGTQDLDENAKLVTNELRAHAERTLQEFRVSPEMLREMGDDLAIISVRLIVHYVGRADDCSKEEWEQTVENARLPLSFALPQPKKNSP